jgi:hypothetical protein
LAASAAKEFFFAAKGKKTWDYNIFERLMLLKSIVL